MLDNFLAELFAPDTPVMPAGGGMGGPAPVTTMLSARSAMPSPPMANVPMPRPRPDVAGMLQGSGGGGAPVAPPAGGGTMDLAARLRHAIPGSSGGATPTSKLSDRILASLAGGFSGGNPAFAGGAFMQGAGGAISGGRKAGKEQNEADTAAKLASQKQANFERKQTDKERTSKALRGLYGARSTRALRGPRKTWDKPVSERWKDAQKLILEKEKALGKNVPEIGLTPRERAAREAENKAALDEFRRETYEKYGFDQNGVDIGSGAVPGAEVPSTPGVVGDKEAMDKGLYPKGTWDDPARPTTQEEFDALPRGTIFINPSDNRKLTKK